MSIACAVLRCTDKWNGYTFKRATAPERRRADNCYTVGNCYARKAATTKKRRRADTCYAVGNSYTHKVATAIEGIFADALNTSVRRNDAILTS